MKRKIKFRGKSVQSGEFVIGDLLKNEGRVYIHPDVRNEYARFQVDPSTVGQYTGLKDKDGVEIYEGDIVKVKIYNTRTEGMGVVEWNNETCVFGLRIGGFLGSKSIAGTWRTIEVIGNIHDNSQLLEEKE